MRLEIAKIVYPGRSMGANKGKVIFTNRGLPGETVEVTVVKDKKNHSEAKTLRILEASPHRAEPRCSHHLACSPYQEMDYLLQLETKRRQVQEMCVRGLGIELPGIAVVPSPEIWGYRNRIKLRVRWEEGKAHLAYNRPEEEDMFVNVEKCYLASDAANALLEELRRIIENEEWTEIASVEIRDSRSREKALAVLHCLAGARTEELAARLSGLQERYPLSGIVALVNDGGKIRPQRLGGVPRIQESIRGVSYKIGPRSFFQTNVGILENVFDDMAEAVRPSVGRAIADLYCGLGTFGMFLAREAREVYGVESDPANIAFLKRNLAVNHIGNFTVCEGTSEEWLPWILEKKPGALILDPPRRGVGSGMLDALVDKPVPRLLYLSCNPATLVRDLKVLLGAYRLEEMKLYDFFPHTPHIESLALLVT